MYSSESNVNKSGNSDVDVTVIVETSALAYAFLCFMYIDGRINKEQYDEMVAEMKKVAKEPNTNPAVEKKKPINRLRLRNKK
ncbi:hypothetical protein [Alkalihalobacillus sp. LMS39]|uniref:hypothetical protein n=1 Tax=Alkalihalobacillus sp. LMS39 TaxID=2924032 RepID=UPI001FB533DB|nr:hypothetical protein [Alkalihalobacillus sp. LMS39]UOE94538.1 hypothetical protein MM271_02395 [Alkalihalobacillus sp. LMS39]